MVCTIALRSRTNHKYSLRNKGSRPKRAFLAGRESNVSDAKAPLSPLPTDRALKTTAATTNIAQKAQQKSTPRAKENSPFAPRPRNGPSKDQESVDAGPNQLPNAAAIRGMIP